MSRTWEVVKRSVVSFYEDQATHHAAAVTYYALMSLFPMFAAAVPGPGALAPNLTERVAEQLARWFGASAGEMTHLRKDVGVHGQPAQTPPLNPAAD